MKQRNKLRIPESRERTQRRIFQWERAGILKETNTQIEVAGVAHLCFQLNPEYKYHID